MKKSIALILAVAMLMIACVACGGDTADKNLPADETRLQQGSMFTVQGGEIVKVLMQGKKTEGGYTIVGEGDPAIDALVMARYEAKKAKNFAEADRIRDELKAQGIEIVDTKDGASWKRV